MKAIELPKGRVTIVDDDDFAELAQYRWYRTGGGYVARRLPMVNGKQGKQILMHPLIMAPIPPGMEVDHINGDKLDNRRCNLRLSTHAENVRNRGKCRNKIEAKGVHRLVHKTKPPTFRAGIRLNGKQRWLGCFPTVEEAIAAYNKAALELHGAFARLN